MDMQMMLQQALQPKGSGGAASTATMPEQEAPMMAPEQGGDIVAQIQEQLAEIEMALNETRDPREFQQLNDAKRQLMEMLEEVSGQQEGAAF